MIVPGTLQHRTKSVDTSYCESPATEGQQKPGYLEGIQRELATVHLPGATV